MLITIRSYLITYSSGHWQSKVYFCVAVTVVGQGYGGERGDSPAKTQELQGMEKEEGVADHYYKILYKIRQTDIS